MRENPAAAPQPPVSTARTVAFLTEQAFPGEVLDVIETHMSWVFLTSTLAYKLKKSVKFDFLDYSSVEARRRDCEAELKLNQDLAPGVYLETTPIGLGPSGLQIGGQESVVDWLVVMRRLPSDQMLDNRLRVGDVTDVELDRLAQVLVAFHERARSVSMSPAEYRGRLELAVRAHGDMLERPEFGLDIPVVAHITDTLTRWVAESDLLDGRASKLVDGHGDLRAEHVILGPKVLIIDRLSFDADLRVTDPVHELATLAVEGEALGAPGIGRGIVERYSRFSRQECPPQLVAFYVAEKAMLRARLSIAHALDPGSDLRHWRDVAQRYVNIAAARLDQLGSAD